MTANEAYVYYLNIETCRMKFGIDKEPEDVDSGKEEENDRTRP